MRYMFKPIACAADMESHDKRKNTTATSRNYSFQSTLPALTCRHASRSIARGVAFLSVCSQTWCFHFIYLATSTQKASRKYNEMDSSRKRNEDGCASTKKMAHLNKLIQSQCYVWWFIWSRTAVVKTGRSRFFSSVAGQFSS